MTHVPYEVQGLFRTLSSAPNSSHFRFDHCIFEDADMLTNRLGPFQSVEAADIQSGLDTGSRVPASRWTYSRVAGN